MTDSVNCVAFFDPVSLDIFRSQLPQRTQRNTKQWILLLGVPGVRRGDVTRLFFYDAATISSSLAPPSSSPAPWSRSPSSAPERADARPPASRRCRRPHWRSRRRRGGGSL